MSIFSPKFDINNNKKKSPTVTHTEQRRRRWKTMTRMEVTSLNLVSRKLQSGVPQEAETQQQSFCLQVLTVCESSQN